MPFKNRSDFYKSRKNWKIKNPEKLRDYERKYNLNAREEIWKLLGDECRICGFEDKRALQVDHINGDGYKDRKVRSVRKLLYQIRKSPERFQILCANCNWIKRIENKEFNKK
jgi:hypothetical protein